MLPQNVPGTFCALGNALDASPIKDAIIYSILVPSEDNIFHVRIVSGFLRIGRIK